MKAVSNATPLIYLSKLGKLDLLKEIFEQVLIPESVYKEVVVRGKELNKPEVIHIENLIKSGYMKIEKVSTGLEINTLHTGELEAISLALEKGIKNILIDDKEGVEVSLLLGLTPWRTTALLLALLKKRLINISEFKGLLLKLSRTGYFIRAEIFDYLIKEAERFGG